MLLEDIFYEPGRVSCLQQVKNHLFWNRTEIKQNRRSKKIELKSSALKLKPIKSLEITGAERKPFRGGNGISQKVSGKDCILNLSSDDFSHLSRTLHSQS